MSMLSEDDLDFKGMIREELEKAWDLWFELAQATNDTDPPYTHGVFVSTTGPHQDGADYSSPGGPPAASSTK
jgi:hypothetical protein